ncbi:MULTISPECIES: hypothetical protein [Paenibacillus]|uniref:hypothetical protein n=1 Tax=Paenibacillus TaxID=44249 RepID=UPI000409D19E|nr:MULTISPECIES: hypothetical protein [Paenibacillus]
MNDLNSDKPFGSYAAHQPNYEDFQQLGKQDDYIFQSLVHLGNASHHVSWGLTVLEYTDVPVELKEEIRQLQRAVKNVQEQLRAHEDRGDGQNPVNTNSEIILNARPFIVIPEK